VASWASADSPPRAQRTPRANSRVNVRRMGSSEPRSVSDGRIVPGAGVRGDSAQVGGGSPLEGNHSCLHDHTTIIVTILVLAILYKDYNSRSRSILASIYW
jgi:hypothetical protein